MLPGMGAQVYQLVPEGLPIVPQTNWGFSRASYSFLATKVVDSPRYAELERKASYYRCRQHDHKQYDFDGRSQAPGPYTVNQPLMSNQAAPFYVPLKDRRPSAPLRLGKQIVGAFTKLVFGEDRWPELLCKEDVLTQEFVRALVLAAKLPTRMIQARNKAGSQGAVGVSWYFHEGRPIVEVHDVKTLHVHEWADNSTWRPAHVTKCYRTTRSVWDPERRAVVEKAFWYRRDWTTQADILYKEVECKANTEPAWEIDEERSSLHGDGVCHLSWIQNIPSEEQDSEPDYEGLYEKMDEVDVVNSVVCRGAKLNLDPTLLLKMEAESIGAATVKKGSEHALVVGLQGDARYLEIGGAGLDMGGKQVDNLKQQILDEAECVIPDPDKVAAGSVSSVALKVIYAPMLNKVGLIRQSFGDAILELVKQMLKVARERWKEVGTTTGEDGGEVEQEVTNYLVLPPKVEEAPVLDELGNETGEVSIQISEREPGRGKELELQWGEMFKPNSADVQATVTTMSTAVGGKPVLSQKSAVEVVAAILGKDPAKVLEEIEGDNKVAMALNGSMFGLQGAGDTMSAGEAPAADMAAELERGAAQEAAEHGLDEESARKIAADHLREDPGYYQAAPQGGQVAPGSAGQPVPGGLPAPSSEAPLEGAAPAELSLTSSDLGAIVTVNEARARYGMGPLMTGGKADPDGDLTLTEFKAKRSSTVAAAASAEKGQDPNAPKPEPQPFGGKPGFGGGKPPFGKKPPAEEEGVEQGKPGAKFPPK